MNATSRRDVQAPLLGVHERDRQNGASAGAELQRQEEAHVEELRGQLQGLERREGPGDVPTSQN